MLDRKSLLLVAGLAGVALLGGTALAQDSTTGAVQGVVKDKTTGEPMGGVAVVATSPAMQGSQTGLTEADGSYKVTGLPPGTYTLVFYYSTDIAVQKNNVTVQVNHTSPVYLTIDSSKAGGEKIIIQDRGPTIDPTSTSQGITLNQDYTRNIPVPGRTFEDTLGAAAGSQGDALGVSFSGSTSLENQYVVDGVNTTGLTYGTVGSPVINDFIQEIEVITGGYQAEYGRATGGVVNVVTKSGSNEFHGTVFTYATNSLLYAGEKRAPSQSNSIDPVNSTNYDLSLGFDLGGPIIKDKLWFYVGFAPRLISVDTERITKRQTDCRIREPGGSLSVCDPVKYGDGKPDQDSNGFVIYEDIPGGTKQLNSQSQEYQFVSKINYAMSPEHQGQATVSGTPFTTEREGSFGLPSAEFQSVNSFTTDTALKWTSKFNNNKTEAEAVLGWHRDSLNIDSAKSGADGLPRENLYFGNLGTWSNLGYEQPATKLGCTDSNDMTKDPYPFMVNCPDRGQGYSVGGPGGIADQVEQRLSARLGVTQRLTKLAGNHEVKAGLDIENNLLAKKRILSGDSYYDILIGQQIDEIRWVKVAPPGDTSAEYNQTCGTARGAMGGLQRCEFLGPTNVEGNTLNWAAYLRDSWQIMPNLTFNAGVRYEEQRLRYAKFLQNTPDPFTGELRGKNAMTMQNMWAPRIGLLYDWTKEGRSKIYASYGRFYESIPMDINDRSFGGETELRRTFANGTCGANKPGYGAPGGPQCDAMGATGTDQLFGGAGVLVARGIKPQYLDEVILGTEYEVLEDLKIGASLQDRFLGRVVEDMSTDNAQTYVLGNPGDFSDSDAAALEKEIMNTTDVNRKAQLTNELAQFKGINTFDKPRRDYQALQLTATKRFSKNFFMQGSYTYARTEGNYPGLYSDNNGQVDPNISSQFDLIELLSNRDGPLPNDRPHYFKLDGYYTFDFHRAGKLTTGARIRALSGTPINALGKHYLYGFNESFLLPRGEMGRVGPNWNADLHLGYSRDLDHGMTLEVFTDIFSLFNTQYQAAVDEAYTFSPANPVVGGQYKDLIWLKAQDDKGGATSSPAIRNRNFMNTAARYQPFWMQFGARLSF